MRRPHGSSSGLNATLKISYDEQDIRSWGRRAIFYAGLGRFTTESRRRWTYGPLSSPFWRAMGNRPPLGIRNGLLQIRCAGLIQISIKKYVSKGLRAAPKMPREGRLLRNYERRLYYLS